MQATTAQQEAVERAVEASMRLFDAATKVGNACFEACQETVLGIPALHEKVAGAAPVDWSKLVHHPAFPGNNRLGPAFPGNNRLGTAFPGNNRLGPAFPGNNRLGEPWQQALGGAVSADDLVAAGKRVCLECVDAYEQAALTAIDLHERVAEATNLDWMRSIASTHAGLGRDVTEAYVSSVRQLLQ
jgi:hypothetical protein